jgi:Na+/H+ antiporter NhaC
LNTVVRNAVDLWNGAKLVVPLVGILFCVWLFVSLITSDSTFEDALALGTSSSALSQGELITRCFLLLFFMLFAIAYAGHKIRRACDQAVTDAAQSKRTHVNGDSIFGD